MHFPEFNTAISLRNIFFFFMYEMESMIDEVKRHYPSLHLGSLNHYFRLAMVNQRTQLQIERQMFGVLGN